MPFKLKPRVRFWPLAVLGNDFYPGRLGSANRLIAALLFLMPTISAYDPKQSFKGYQDNL